MRKPIATSLLLALATCLCASPALFAADTPGNGDLAVARQLQNAFEKVAETVSPAVVVITVMQRADSDDMSAEEMLEYFFREHKWPERSPRKKLPDNHPPVLEQAEGSGLIVRADGYILTNAHVIEGAEKITVRLKDDRKFTATVVGSDDRTDLAVIKINEKNLPAARFADSGKVRVGQWAIAIGAPFQLDYSFTVGFVSAKGRSGLMSRGSSAYEDYIQTDASINPGNSGGPLVNIESEVIGINTLIRGLRTNIGFAIPSTMARGVADQLIANKRVIRPWLGVEIASVSDADELREYLKGPKEGVLIRSVVPAGPAAKSDLRQSDIVTAVAGHTVRNTKELQQAVLGTRIGDSITLDVFRDGKTLKVAVKTAEMPVEKKIAAVESKDSPAARARTYGLTVHKLTPEIAGRFGATLTEGVVVAAVEDNSPADAKGLQPGDVITEVDHKTVRTVKEFNAALAAADAKRGVLLNYNRRGKTGFTVLKEEAEEPK
ncbi:MAG: PDZ domain-containing protein [Verrucomicrobia bacterium]|nr:PDZ domain-containing protein [Verrucomicrobiota bacterium]